MTESTSTSSGHPSFDGIADNARHGHGTRSSRRGGNRSCYLSHLTIDIAPQPVAINVGLPHIKHYSSRFHHVRPDETCPAYSCNENVCLSCHLRKVLRARMSNRDSRATPQEEGSGGLSDEVGAPYDNHPTS